MVVAVNKLDIMGWAEERFTMIKERLLPYLVSIGYKKERIFFVPISGLKGVNLNQRPKDLPELTSWYDSNCLTEQLDLFVPPKK